MRDNPVAMPRAQISAWGVGTRSADLLWADNWAATTKDGRKSAQFECDRTPSTSPPGQDLTACACHICSATGLDGHGLRSANAVASHTLLVGAAVCPWAVGRPVVVVVVVAVVAAVAAGWHAGALHPVITAYDSAGTGRLAAALRA